MKSRPGPRVVHVWAHVTRYRVGFKRGVASWLEVEESRRRLRVRVNGNGQDALAALTTQHPTPSRHLFLRVNALTCKRVGGSPGRTEIVSHESPTEETEMVVTLPIRLVNPLNRREHWAVRSKRNAGASSVARMALTSRAGLAARSQARACDADPDLAASVRRPRQRAGPFKSLVDGIADALGLSSDRADGVSLELRLA